MVRYKLPSTDEEKKEGDEDEEEDEAVRPVHFQAATYHREDMSRFYVSLAGAHPDDGGLHLCRFGVPQPLQTFPAHDTRLGGNGAVLAFSQSGNLLVSGGADGAVVVRSSVSGGAAVLDKFVALRVHNSAAGGVADVALSHDEKFLLTVGRDDQILVTQLDGAALEKIATGAVTDLSTLAPLNPAAVREAAAAAAKVAVVGGGGAAGGGAVLADGEDITSNQAYVTSSSTSVVALDRPPVQRRIATSWTD